MTTDTTTGRELALPQTFDELQGLAKAFVASGMFTDIKQLSQAIVKIQAGRELGLPPVFSMQNINLIRGRLTSSANTLALLIKKSGRYNYRIVGHTDEHCTIAFDEQQGGKWVGMGETTWTIADAKRADLVKPDSGWQKYPRAMLFARAISEGGRKYCPDAIGGMYTDEEIRAIPPRPNEDAAPTVRAGAPSAGTGPGAEPPPFHSPPGSTPAGTPEQPGQPTTGTTSDLSSATAPTPSTTAEAAPAPDRQAVWMESQDIAKGRKAEGSLTDEKIISWFAQRKIPMHVMQLTQPLCPGQLSDEQLMAFRRAVETKK